MGQASVVIVGGGVMGASAACFLARDHGTAVTVLERDPSHALASSALSASSIRVQFSTPVDIALSQASLALMRPWADERGFVEAGCLYLVGADGAATLRQLHTLRCDTGAWVAPLAAALGVSLLARARKRGVFMLDSPAALRGCPLLIDPSGVWLRPEGRGMQQALGVGRGLASLMVRGDRGGLDLSAPAPERLNRKAALRKINVI